MMLAQSDLYRVSTPSIYCVTWTYFNMCGIISTVYRESQKVFTGPGGDGKGRLVHMGKTSSWGLSYQKKMRDDVQLHQRP